MKTQTFKSLVDAGKVNQIISDLFLDNYSAYPADYAGPDAKENAIAVAKGYFANRSEEEIDRDNALEVTEADYIEIVLDRLECLKNK